ncbi:GGDEF domain-containing protein [Dyella mobilis]|uniref:diguanylate cyclase n=1 Tax=Dyella mobilis TaxID=1849582 RepID=A0ABS2KKY6_9GAMM|nr:GGDEF domain-containing protein [Dyella mobilis]MBM7131823.1 GGDEF domain-containing protein [Dyella mobilis]
MAVTALLSTFICASIGATATANATPDDTARLFARADEIKLVDNASYVKLIAQLENRSSTLSETDKWHLRYLEGWQATYVGQNDKALRLLGDVIKQASDDDLQEQARATIINILSNSHHYEEAFSYLDQALDELPHIVRNSTRQHVLAEAAQLLSEAGQYDLAISYAEQLMQIPAANDYSCIGNNIKLDTEFLKGPHTESLLSQLQGGVQTCIAAGHLLIADRLRKDIASIEVEQGKLTDAIALLQGTYTEVSKLQYPEVIAGYDDLLAEAYWKQNDASLAEKYATATVDVASKADYVAALSKAYQLLYQIAREKGNLSEALVYHEKYMSTDNTRLDDVREKALAYQLVKQQVEAKKVELNSLSKQNQILELQQALDHKAVEASRLYIALLLTVLASIVLWLYRLKRSQLRFMRMAHHDGLTDIYNRQHFVHEAEQALRFAAKSTQPASLLLIDLDHFKAINDTHGHVAGDQVLCHAVAICQRYLHSNDIFGRLGGEEFGILLTDCSAEVAIERAEQIRLAIYTCSREEDECIPISVSLGIASTTHHGHDLHLLLIAADEALYRAKRDGRNRVVINISPSGSATRTSASGARPVPVPPGREPFDYAAGK